MAAYQSLMQRWAGRRWRRGAALAVVAVGLALPACGDPGVAGSGKIAEIGKSPFPKKVLGLTVTREPTSALTLGFDDTYLEAVGLWGFRRGKLLQATLQIGKFTGDANVEDERFRRSVASQVGSTLPQESQMSNQTVYLSAGARQSLAIWFYGDYLFVLATRDEYDTPRTLLRELIDLDL